MNMDLLRQFIWEDDSGQGLVEYALIIALVAIVVIGAIVLLRDEISQAFTGAADELNSATGGTTTTTTP